MENSKGRNEKTVESFKTKQKAVDFGRKDSKKPPLGQLIIQKKGGTIQEECTCGKDPYPSKGLLILKKLSEMRFRGSI